MTTSRAAINAALSMVVCLTLVADAQRGRGASGEKPKVDVVQSVGCAERKPGQPDTWWLNRAADPRVSQAGMFNSNQVEEAKGAALGGNVFQLIGVAEFVDPDDLLRTGQRKEFTAPATANATGQLRAGHKLLVKGMLVDAGEHKRINLLSVIDVGETCG